MCCVACSTHEISHMAAQQTYCPQWRAVVTIHEESVLSQLKCREAVRLPRRLDYHRVRSSLAVKISLAFTFLHSQCSCPRMLPVSSISWTWLMAAGSIFRIRTKSRLHSHPPRIGNHRHNTFSLIDCSADGIVLPASRYVKDLSSYYLYSTCISTANRRFSRQAWAFAKIFSCHLHHSSWKATTRLDQVSPSCLPTFSKPSSRATPSSLNSFSMFWASMSPWWSPCAS